MKMPHFNYPFHFLPRLQIAHQHAANAEWKVEEEFIFWFGETVVYFHFLMSEQCNMLALKAMNMFRERVFHNFEIVKF